MVRRLQRKMNHFNNRSLVTIGGAALVIAVTGVISRLLGFVRDRVLASTFGASDILDTYYAAFRLPDLFYGLLVAGALSAAFVPLFTEYLSDEREEDAFRLTSGVLWLVAVTLGVLSLLGMLFAPWLVHVLVPGFSGEQKELTVTMTRIMLFSPFFLGLSAVLGGVLVSYKRFVAYSLAPIFYNLGIIFGIVFLVPSFGVLGIAWGVVLGSVLHMLVQYPGFRAAGFFYVPPRHKWFWQEADIRRVLTLMVPRSLSMGVTQVSLFVVTIVASTLTAGSLAAFNFANNIQSVPLGIFGVAFSLAAFPVLSAFAAKKQGRDFFNIIASTSKRILFFVIPLSMLMVLFRAQIVRIVLGSGAFNWEDTIMTFELLKYFAFSLFAQCLIPLFARAFFALQDTKTPLYIALVSEGVHVLALLLMLPYMGVNALAFTFSLATVVNFVLLYTYLRRRSLFWDDRDFLVPVMKMVVAALVAGLLAQISKEVFALTTNELDTFWEVFLQLLAGTVIGLGMYVLLAGILKIEELEMFRKLFLRKLLRQPEVVVTTEDHPERGEW